MKPEQLTDYWGIAGTGDIPGVKGVGKKGATELIAHFGSLEAIFNHNETSSHDKKQDNTHDESVFKNKSAFNKLIAQQKEAELSAAMATLKYDLELGLTLRDLKYTKQS